MIASALQASSDVEGGEPVSSAAAAQGMALVAFGLAVAPLAAWAARRLFPGRNVFFARWGFSHVAIVLAFTAVLLFGARLALSAVEVSELSATGALVLQSVLFLPVAALVFAIAGARDPDGWRSLGLHRGRWGRAMGVGALAYVVAAPAMVGLQACWHWLLDRYGIEYSAQHLVEQARALDGADLAVFAVLAVLVAPFFEELLFRAFLQPLLVQNLGDRGGVAVTAFLFALMHGSLAAFTPIFALGLVLGMVMLRTQRLAAPWTLHALHNGLTLWMLTAFPID